MASAQNTSESSPVWDHDNETCVYVWTYAADNDSSTILPPYLSNEDKNTIHVNKTE